MNEIKKEHKLKREEWVWQRKSMMKDERREEIINCRSTGLIILCIYKGSGSLHEKRVHKIVQQSSKYKKEEIESGVSMRGGKEGS